MGWERELIVRSVRLREFGQDFASLRLEETEAPTPGSGDVLIAVEACGVNFPDLLVVGGTYQKLPELPFVPGKELAGTVTAVGADVTRFAVGDRVMSQIEAGAFAEEVAVPEGRCYPIPDDLGFDEASTFGLVYGTAYVALTRRANYAEGETVLVTAASGSVGSAAVQIASSLGARTIAVVRSEDAVVRATEDGAEHVIVAADPASLKDRVYDITDSRGADVVIEAVGGELFGACLRATAWEGRIVSVGYASGDVPTVKAGHLLVKNIGVCGLQISDYQAREQEFVAAAYAHILELRGSGNVKIRVAERFAMESPGDALAAVAAGGLSGRVVMTVSR
jgi:NADPH:quinone reductase-like Zn-dependent oxidoreductase